MNIDKIKKAKTLQELELATRKLDSASESEKNEIANLLADKAKEAIEESKASRKKAEELLAKITQKKVSILVDNIEYPLEEWVTLTEYIKRFKLKSTTVVSNWIARGIIPEKNVLKVPQLNIQLVKAIPYTK
ncbi:hypothetical protein GOQ04_03430 [Emticicia sp. ODNR4P]|nr:hypothetical protein [Emticicia sp. ODNR4P]